MSNIIRSKHIPYTIEELRNEVWKISTNEKYEVSNLGRVRNSKNKVLVNTYITHDGYIGVDRTICRVHREVAIAFIPNKDNLETVNHIDGNKQNNKVSNLEWMSRKDNSNHAVETGLWTNNFICSLTNISTNETKQFMSFNRLCKFLGYKPLTILPRVKYSAIYPINGKYIIKLENTELEKPINTSGKENSVIYVYDYLLNKWSKYNSLLSVVYHTGIKSSVIIKHINNGVNYCGYGYIITYNKLVNTPKLRCNSKILEGIRDLYYKKSSHIPIVNDVYYLYDYWTGIEYSGRNSTDILNILTKINPKLHLTLRQVQQGYGKLSTMNKPSLLYGYGLTTSKHRFSYDLRTLNERIRSQYNKTGQVTVFKVENDKDTYYIAGSGGLLKFLELNNKYLKYVTTKEYDILSKNSRFPNCNITTI